MLYSTWLGLNLPELTDAADVREINENFETLDAIIGGGVADDSVDVRADELADEINSMSRNLGGGRLHITVTADTGAIAGDLNIVGFYNGILQITFENNTGDTVGTTCDHAVNIGRNAARIEIVNQWLVSTATDLVYSITDGPVHYYTKFKVYGETTTGTTPLLVYDDGKLIGHDGAVITLRSKAATVAALVYDGGEIVSPAAIAAVLPDRILYVYSGGVVRMNGAGRPDQFKVGTGGQLICKAQRIPLSSYQAYVTDGVGDLGTLVEMNEPTWWVYESGDMVHAELASVLPMAIKNGCLYGFVATGAIPDDALEYTLWPENTLPGGGTGGHIQFIGSAAQDEHFVSIEEMGTW
jgi:hypothetical protein